MPDVNLALIQQRYLGSTAAMLEQTAKDVHTAAQQGATLIVLQELQALPYFCQSEDTANFDFAENIPGDYSRFIGELAEAHQCVIVACGFEERAPGIYHNSAIVVEKTGELAGRYRKMHIPDDPGFYEKFYFTPGDAQGTYQGFEPISTSVGKLGVLICWDQWYPEAARLMALAGAELLIYPTAIGWDRHDCAEEQARQLDAWITIQRSHAIANHLPLIACNRVGFEAHPTEPDAGIDFWGNSFICDHQGALLERASADDAAVLTAQIDLDAGTKFRQIWPFLRDRRIDAYQGLTQRFID